MDTSGHPSSCGCRRNEDIALDLFKFIASAVPIARTPAAATGFGAASISKPDEQVAQMLELYNRCLAAVSRS
jgi:hypothetical protein